MLILLFCGYVYGAAFCTFMYDFIINIYHESLVIFISQTVTLNQR